MISLSILSKHNYFFSSCKFASLCTLKSRIFDLNLQDLSSQNQDLSSQNPRVANTFSIQTANSKEVFKLNVQKHIKELQQHQSDTGSSAVQGRPKIFF